MHAAWGNMSRGCSGVEMNEAVPYCITEQSI